jgi:hypothetical protein
MKIEGVRREGGNEERCTGRRKRWREREGQRVNMSWKGKRDIQAEE